MIIFTDNRIIVHVVDVQLLQKMQQLKVNSYIVS